MNERGKSDGSVVPEKSPNKESGAPLPAEGPFLVSLSAHTPEALNGLASRWRTFLSEPGPSLQDVGFTSTRRRAHHEERLALVAGSREGLAQQLQEADR